MTPMPQDALALQRAMIALHARLEEIDYPKDTPHLLPQVALMIACIGDQELHSRQIIRFGYWPGKNVSHPINYLVRSGIVNRRTIPNDRRVVLYSLTPKGLAVCERIRKELTSDKEKPNAFSADSNGRHDDLALMGAGR